MFLELATLPSSLALQDPAAGGSRTNASCSSDFNWARSSVGTSPCLIAAEVLGACNGGKWNLPSLLDDVDYAPPNVTTANPCFCSWSAYNLLSACSACQGHEEHINDWTVYQLSCSLLGLSNTYFPKNISSPILIPYWATLDPIKWPNHRFNITSARLLSSQKLNDTIPRNPNWQSSMASPSAPPTSGLIGGVIGLLGGLAGIIFAADLVLYMIYRERRRRLVDNNYHVSNGQHHAIALISPPSHRRADTGITTPETPVDALIPERTRRLPFTHIFI
ncbi:hypothetical protein BDZ94DRAFT_639058 [Collybia nuda]|uniref:Uncharacterized protein n=1 Tax=Collybia nuda TaxID=64659 RepID=A0A9P6CIB2_9AGAR|nr:hypothetical protein BDZ94DRAFT_639058 [Collybia nuda]